MQIETVYLHEGRKDVTLTAYIAHVSSELPASGKRPAILILPGGGYLNCSDREAEPIALRFAAMGYQAFILRYSVYFEGASDWGAMDGEPVPKDVSLFPNSLREVGQAILMMRARAAEWHLDADRLAVCGFSAGAHNAAMYGVNWHREVITDYFKVDQELLRPNALILGYGLYDSVNESTERSNPMDRKMMGFKNVALTGTAEPSDEVKHTLSPCLHVTKETPPAYLWCTAEDTLVPSQQSLRLALALANAGVPYELHVFEKGMHGLSLADQATSMSQKQILPDTAKWIEMVESWLLQRFALNIPEKSFLDLMLEEAAAKQ